MFWKVLASSSATAASWSSATFSLCCGCGGGRLTVLAHAHSASAASSRWQLRGIGLLLQRFQRRYPQRHANAKVRAGHLAVDDFHGALVHIDELVHHRQADAGAAHVAAHCATGVEGIEDAGSIFVPDTPA